MKNNYKQKRAQGFTIIEVMIVLAIAAVILLIVLLAVPALQRSSRNTQRKNDVSKLLSAVNTYMANHNSTLPASANFITAFPDTPTLNIYDDSAGNVTWTKQGSASAPGDPANLDQVNVYSNSACNATGTASSTTGASTRSIIALYDVETSGGMQEQCQTG